MGYSNLIGVITLGAIAGVLVAANTNLLIGYLVFHAIVAAFFAVSTASRGIIADVLFAVFWPIYLVIDWKAGKL